MSNVSKKYDEEKDAVVSELKSEIEKTNSFPPEETENEKAEF